mmetsp:Transcript_96471/g.273193  ORF Transcript_96471/g.273193 Transcript_96471/m.273193 type:complete len:230 (-) Transcript_96471:121-810(-)
MSGDDLRRHPRPVPRPHGALPHRRLPARHELPLPRGLRGPRLLLGRVRVPAPVLQGPLPGADHDPAREPREPADHADLRLLRRVHAKVQQRERVEKLHGPLRLLAADGARGEQDLHAARRALAEHRQPRRRAEDRPRAGGAARGPDVRPAVERPRRPPRLGRQPAGGRVHVRPRHLREVQPQQRAHAHRASAPAHHGGLQLVPRAPGGHHILSAELLLPMRQPGRDHGD